jgi:hypothetical protein
MALQNKVRYNKKLIEYIKAGAVIAAFVFFLGVYIYYVNKASTLGYFYRNEQKTRDNMEFDYNIQSFETTKKYEQLWDSTMGGLKYLGSNSENFSLKDSQLLVQE